MNWGDNLTLIGALRGDRWLTLGTCWRGMKAATFEHWVRTRLAPRLRPRDVVLLDNLRAHKTPAVRQLIEARGASLRFLPPYSHDFNPIEPAWAKLKALLRGLGARTLGALEAALTTLVDAITAADAAGFFRHCGYAVQ